MIPSMQGRLKVKRHNTNMYDNKSNIQKSIVLDLSRLWLKHLFDRALCIVYESAEFESCTRT